MEERTLLSRVQWSIWSLQTHNRSKLLGVFPPTPRAVCWSRQADCYVHLLGLSAPHSGEDHIGWSHRDGDTHKTTANKQQLQHTLQQATGQGGILQEWTEGGTNELPDVSVIDL